MIATPTTTRDPLHILLILYEYPVGSPQTIRWANILRYAIEAGHSLTILSASFEVSDRPIDESLRALLDHPNVALHQVPAASRDYGQVQMLRWSQRAFERARELTAITHFDVAISSALPIADHIIASRLRGGGHIPLWIADYGDPWSTSRTLGQAAWRKPLYMAIERRILKHADAITITTPTALDSFTPLYDNHEHIAVIPMGASYFHMNMDWHHQQRDDVDTLNLLYPGSFYPTRRPDKLFEAISQVDGVHLTIIGTHFIDISDDVARYNIEGRVTLQDYANQRQIAEMQRDFDVLLLTSWPVPEQISGKFYEYIATDKPILYVSNHETDIASDYMRQHDSGYITPNTVEDIAQMFTHVRDEARAGRLKSPAPATDVGFDTRAQQLMTLIDRLTQVRVQEPTR